MNALALIVAMNAQRAIGKAGALPWHVSEDLKRFKALTLGHAVVMGRKTHESIGRALPGRRNIVVTRGASSFAGCESAASLGEALTLARQTDAMPFVIGGGQLYELALPVATHLFITQVDREVEGVDAFFPLVDWSAWRETQRTEGPSGVTFIDYVR